MCSSPAVNLLVEQKNSLVRLLLSDNADPNIRTKEGLTPLRMPIHLKSTSQAW